MRSCFMKIAGMTAVIIVVTWMNAFAQDKTPVRIEFDENSGRVDLITGRELSDYTQAKRGSIRFFLGRLDKPDDFVDFFHDGVRQARISSLKSLEKVQGKFAIWRLRYKSGSKNTPRIHHLAVSFIPLSPKTGETERRVYVLLNDLKLIEWGNDE
ncbi:hypothetical protein ACFL1R_02095 [Candidatus Latescibacterota bacterium]